MHVQITLQLPLCTAGFAAYITLGPIPSLMEFELLLKVAAVLASAIGAWKVLSEITRARSTSVRDDYRFAKEFLADLKAKESMHPYLRDKGYEALVSGRPLSTREIEYLLSLPEPVRSLREYASSRKYLQHASTAGTKQLLIKRRYRKSWVLNVLLWAYLLLFLGAYTAAWSPLLFAAVSQQLGASTVSSLAVTLLAFGPVAYFFFRQSFGVASALSLIRREGVRGS